MDDSLMTLDDYITIIKRHKWSLIGPVVIVMALAAFLALILPPVYKSTATILIEEQEIPSDFVKAAVTSYAEQRIQTINQRIMSSARLLEIIDRFDLYHSIRNSETVDEVVDKMRRDTKLEMINAEMIDPRSGKSSEVTIAFALSYEGKDGPRKIQQVANTLTSLFLEENLRERVQQTQETAKFLEDEMKKVKDAIDKLDADIAEFKEKNINNLPELLHVNTQNLSNVENSIEKLGEQLRSQKDREGYLQAQLAGISPLQEDKQRLDELRIILVQLKTRFTDEYPDVIKTKAEIADLERQLAAGGSAQNSRNALADNPAYATLTSQLASTRAEIQSLKAQIQGLGKKAEKYQRQIDNTPRVEQTYRKLLSERNNTQAKYDDLMSKVMEARVSQGLEKEQKGERFTLIDPARLPEKPFKPNRLVIALIGLMLGLGAGIGLTALREISDTSIHSAKQLTSLTSFPVLSAIPVIATGKVRNRFRLNKVLLTVSVIGTMIGGLVIVHFRFIDLGVFWTKLIQHFSV